MDDGAFDNVGSVGKRYLKFLFVNIDVECYLFDQENQLSLYAK